MKRWVYVSLPVVLFACERHDYYPGLSPIDSEIRIETREVLDPAQRKLTFHCTTEKQYPCINYFISGTTHRQGASFDVLFTGIGIDAICFTAIGPATSLIDLGQPEQGSYPLVFRNGSLKSEGTMVVSRSSIDLLFPDLEGIEIVRSTTRRVPADTYWGTIGYAVESSDALADEFIRSLSAQGALFEKQVPGHYYYYEIDAAGELVTDPEKSGFHFVKGLIFSYAGDESVIRDFILTEGGRFRDKLAINIQTASGGQINNRE